MTPSTEVLRPSMHPKMCNKQIGIKKFNFFSLIQIGASERFVKRGLGVQRSFNPSDLMGSIFPIFKSQANKLNGVLSRQVNQLY